MATMTSSEQNFQNLMNYLFKNLIRPFGSSFIKIAQIVWTKKAVTSTQTNRQGSSRVYVFSPEMTEYKNKLASAVPEFG